MAPAAPARHADSADERYIAAIALETSAELLESLGRAGQRVGAGMVGQEGEAGVAFVQPG